jgi:predicted amidohydrolase
MEYDMTKRRFRAAAVQTLARLGDYDHNIELATKYVEDAVRQGAELIVFPECMDTGYLFDSVEHCRALAETMTDGPFVKALAALSKKYSIYVASGVTEWDPEKEKIFNSGVMFGRNGELVAHYHKQFLATHDQNWFSFGERGCPVVDTDLGRIGLLICFDGRIPEIFRSMTMQGAEVIVDMANFFSMDQADMWGPARSFENGVWLVAATKAGYERSIYYPGGSMIVDPKGRVMSKVSYDTHGLAVCDIDLDAAADKSIYAANDKIADRRPETYGIMALPYAKTPVYGVADKPLVPSKSVTKVAAIQMHVSADSTAADVLDMLDHTAKLGVKVLTVPEYAFSPNCILSKDEANALAEQTSSLLSKVSAIAAKYDCLIALPTVERAAAGLFVTTYLIGPDGKEIGRYRKTHLTAEERVWAHAGDVYPVFETPFGRIGVMSGYDAVFPETSRCLAIGAADIILWPASLREPFERELLAIPRAEDNRVAVILANRVDSLYPGGSVVIPPNGFPLWDINVVAPRVTKLGAVMPKHIDLAVCRQKLMIPKVDVFANRLVETYAPIIAA